MYLFHCPSASSSQISCEQPDRKYLHCWHQTLPCCSSHVLTQRIPCHRAPDGKIITVGSEGSRYAVSVSSDTRVFVPEGDPFDPERCSPLPTQLDEQLATFSLLAHGEVLTVFPLERVPYAGFKVQGPFKRGHSRLRASCLCSFKNHVQVPLCLLNCWKETLACKSDVYLLPEQLDEDMATLHLLAVGAVVTILTHEHIILVPRLKVL